MITGHRIRCDTNHLHCTRLYKNKVMVCCIWIEKNNFDGLARTDSELLVCKEHSLRFT